MKFGKKLAISSKKVFNSEFVHNKNCLKAKKNQQRRKLSMFLCNSNIDWYRKDKNYYLQVFLERYYFIVIEKKMPDFNDIVIYSDDSYNEGSDKEYYDFNDSDEEILMKKFKQIKCIFFFLEKIKKQFYFFKK